jgi:hypothetical protein
MSSPLPLVRVYPASSAEAPYDVRLEDGRVSVTEYPAHFFRLLDTQSRSEKMWREHTLAYKRELRKFVRATDGYILYDLYFRLTYPVVYSQDSRFPMNCRSPRVGGNIVVTFECVRTDEAIDDNIETVVLLDYTDLIDTETLDSSISQLALGGRLQPKENFDEKALRRLVDSEHSRP